MKELSRVASKVTASTTLAIDALAKKMKAEGIAVEDIAKKFNVSGKTIYGKLKL